MTAKEWLEIIKKADNCPIGMDKLIIKYGEMLLEENRECSCIKEKLLKKLCTGFFYYWWNEKGNSTEQGFDDWWEVNKEDYKELFEQSILVKDIKEKLVSFVPSIKRGGVCNPHIHERVKQWYEELEKIK